MQDKFTPIHNEVLEALAKINLSPYETRVLFVVWRKTYGFTDKNGQRKKIDYIALKQFTEITGLDRRHINRALQRLKNKKIIVKERMNIGFSKEFIPVISRDDKEMSSDKMTTVISRDDAVISIDDAVISIDDNLSSKKAHTKESKEIISKETIQKKVIQNKDSDSYKLSDYLYEKILENNPEHKEPNLIEWSKHIDKMIRIDKRDSGKIRAVIDWCQKDNFWYKNILSTQKLREKFDQLILNMGKNKKEDWKDF